jgi:cation:H+ antiporter
MFQGDEPLKLRSTVGLALALCLPFPAIALRITGYEPSHVLAALVFGCAIVGAAFLLSWAAELAQLEMPASLAIGLLALIAVLPEYAVDFIFAFKGGQAVAAYGSSCLPPDAIESPCSLALANMTGANRLLIGIGWPLVVFVAWYRSRRRGERSGGITLSREHSVEVAFLALATLYSLTLPFKSAITVVDTVVLVGIFVAYSFRIAKAPRGEPHLSKTTAAIATLPRRLRRLTTLLGFLYAGVVILLSAERFAEGLVAAGQQFGISEFLLVQWVAPLASEAPELLIAVLFAWHLNSDAGLGTLLSSKVNQWTLLVGTLPLVFALGGGGLGLPIDAQQRGELLITAAQSFFAVAVLSSLSLSTREALLLTVLFWGQFIIGGIVPPELAGVEHAAISAMYMVLGTMILAKSRRVLPSLFIDGFKTAHGELRVDALRPEDASPSHRGGSDATSTTEVRG